MLRNLVHTQSIGEFDTTVPKILIFWKFVTSDICIKFASGMPNSYKLGPRAPLRELQLPGASVSIFKKRLFEHMSKDTN